MQRITISLNESLGGAFDAFANERGYRSRSEAVRDLVRAAVDERDLAGDPTAACVAALSYVYEHHVRDLSVRLTAIGHNHHDLVVSTMHVHLDHRDCLETVILKGPVARVRALADAIRAERGVRFGALNVIGVDLNDTHAHGSHDHGHDGRADASPRRI